MAQPILTASVEGRRRQMIEDPWPCDRRGATFHIDDNMPKWNRGVCGVGGLAMFYRSQRQDAEKKYQVLGKEKVSTSCESVALVSEGRGKRRQVSSARAQVCSYRLPGLPNFFIT